MDSGGQNRRKDCQEARKIYRTSEKSTKKITTSTIQRVCSKSNPELVSERLAKVVLLL